MTEFDQALAQMRTEETRATGNEDTFAIPETHV
jgi:hypothetical protein